MKVELGLLQTEKNCATKRNIIYISNLKISKEGGFDSLWFLNRTMAYYSTEPIQEMRL